MNFNETFVMAKKMDKNKLAAARIRIRYLLGAIDAYVNDSSDIAIRWAWEAIDEAYHLLDKSQYSFSSTDTYNKITNEDVEIARKYPVRDLISFTNGKAYAFCHEDKSPSLSYWPKGNKVRCFVCDQTFDSIGVLMARDGMSFNDAVRQLR